MARKCDICDSELINDACYKCIRLHAQDVRAGKFPEFTVVQGFPAWQRIRRREIEMLSEGGSKEEVDLYEETEICRLTEQDRAAVLEGEEERKKQQKLEEARKTLSLL